MTQDVTQVMRLGPLWRRAILAALSVLAAAAAILWPAARAEAACEANYCFSVTTDQGGTYTLSIPAGFLGLAYPPLADCTWDIEANFGDGSEPGLYTFSAETGITESHIFPEPGVYTVHIYATNGRHGESESPCPDLHLEGTVTYPEPAGEPPPEPPPSEPPEADPVDSSSGSGGAAPTVGTAGPTSEPAGPASPRRRYWRRCRAEVLTHRVGCRRGRRVIRKASRLVRRLGGAFVGWIPTRVARFKCRLRRTPSPELACRRGGRRILAPLRR